MDNKSVLLPHEVIIKNHWKMQRFGEVQCIGMGNDAQVNWGLRGRRMARIKLIRLLPIRFYLLWTLWVWVYWFWMNYKFIIFFYNNYVTIFYKDLLILHLFIFLHDFHLILDYSYMNFLSTFSSEVLRILIQLTVHMKSLTTAEVQ